MIERHRPERIRAYATFEERDAANAANKGEGLKRPRTATLRCRVVGVEGSYRAPNLMKRELSTEERLGNLQPTTFRLILDGVLTADDADAMRALAALSRNGGSVTVRVEVGE